MNQEQSLTIFCEAFRKLSSQSLPIVVVTLVGTRGHAPQDVGARMIIGQDGILFGTVGGGKIEKRCIDTALEYLNGKPATDRTGLFTWNLQRDIGMSCGGEVTVFFEAHLPAHDWNVVVFGAGHVSQQLTRLLLKLNCKLTVIDHRQEWLDRLPKVNRYQKVLTQSMPNQITDQIAGLPTNAYVVIMTMGHATDYPILLAALRSGKKFPYLGVIGSPVKRIKINSELKAEGLSPEQIQSFQCPMGEPWGNNSPPEIAISIISQLIRTRDQLKINK
jgi:xanthine dehydrogenase accessory factor